MVNDQDFPKLTGGLDKGGLDNVEYGNYTTGVIYFQFPNFLISKYAHLILIFNFNLRVF